MKIKTFVPENYQDMIEVMQTHQADIVSNLTNYGIEIPEYPALKEKKIYTPGKAAARAYPIQGVLKYHGMSDSQWRIAYLPSISFNNDAAQTVTLVEFDSGLQHDRIMIGDIPATDRERERVKQLLNAVREMGEFNTRARVISRNIIRTETTGKGLGTSAAASAALAHAAIAAAFGEELAGNMRFVSCMARLLAGSGCRSAAGGISLWLSYPGCSHEDSFAVRLDNHNQLADMRLITLTLDSRIGLKSEQAHEDAPNSTFFKPWMHMRKDEILTCIKAIQEGDWQTIAQWAEVDSIRLHGITMSASMENKIFAWEPENIELFRMCNELRSDGVPVYFSTDTGPTTVFMTHKNYETQVVDRIKALDWGKPLRPLTGKMAGPVEGISVEQARLELGLTGEDW